METLARLLRICLGSGLFCSRSSLGCRIRVRVEGLFECFPLFLLLWSNGGWWQGFCWRVRVMERVLQVFLGFWSRVWKGLEGNVRERFFLEVFIIWLGDCCVDKGKFWIETL